MSPPLRYRDAGVDLELAATLVGRLRQLAATTHGPSVRPFGDAYAGLYALPGGALLAASCDGVGTKLRVGQALGRFRGLGQDLVAMNVNDLLPCGARPLFFLDYLAAARLDPEPLTELVAGMAAACQAVGCALLGGETAELPGRASSDELELAGFAVGLVAGGRLPQPERLAAGDKVLALPSTGIHANGLSLARKALFAAGLTLGDRLPELAQSVGEELLVPTALYVEPVLAAFARVLPEIRAAAHITGGGLLGRARALLRPGLRLELDPTTYRRPPIFDLIARAGPVTEDELARTFNLGLGFLLLVSPGGAAELLAAPDSPWLAVGEVRAGATAVELGYARSD